MSQAENDDFVIVDEAPTPFSPKQVSELKAWLRPTDYLGESSDFKKHLNSHVPGTGEWLQQTTHYQQWHEGAADALWLKAIAGAGKSVLAARLISHLQSTESQTPVLFFFFRQIVASNHGIHSLVRDWMAQLLEFSPHLRFQLRKWREENQRNVEDISFNELWQLLLDCFSFLGKVYCVVDALDELDSEQTDDFLRRLVHLGRTRPGSVKILMTSRPLPQIQKVLNTPSVLQVRLEDRQTNKDISLFIQHRLLLADVDEMTRATIKRSIEDRVHPSFLYARLMLNELLDRHRTQSINTASVDNAILSLPASMEDMYSQMLYDHSQVAGVPQERQLLILQLATHASRPLRLLEIATVLDSLDMRDRAQHGDTKNMTRMSCGPLLEILEDETVSIIHHSFTEFLTDDGRKGRNETFPVIDSIKAHEMMALACIEYLLAGSLSSWKLDPVRMSTAKYGSLLSDDSVPAQQRSLQLQYPFLAYAAHNWYYHARRLPVMSEELQAALERLMSPDSHVFLAWIDAVVKPDYAPESLSPLHVAAWAGLTNAVGPLLDMKQALNGLTGSGQTPLTLAAKRGHADTVACLVKHGALPDEPETAGLKAMHYAAGSNHHTVVQVLIDAGVSPVTPRTADYPGNWCGNSKSAVGETPLNRASRNGCAEVIQVMLSHLSDKERKSSLRRAVGSNQMGVVQLLLDAADIDIKSEYGGELLLKAASKQHFDIMQLLLSKGVDPNYRPRPPGQPGQILAYITHRKPTVERASLLLAICATFDRASNRESHASDVEKVLDVVLAAGCDVNHKGRTGKTALHYCVSQSIICIEKLLQHGADVHATDEAGNTPLHLLRLRGETASIIEALDRYGAKWDVRRSSDGKTPLQICVEQREYSFDINLLQPYFNAWHIPDSAGNTALHVVIRAESWSAANLKVFLDHLKSMGADFNCRNHDGVTPLHLVHSGYHADKYAALLLAAGADLEAKDYKGRTWFLRIATGSSYDQNKTLQKVVAFGVNKQAADYAGNNALHLTLDTHHSHQDVDIVGHLLQAGVDPLHINHGGDTLWHTLMRRSFQYGDKNFQSLVSHLRREKVPVLARNHQGETLLHVACSQSPKYPENRKAPCAALNAFSAFSESEISDLIVMANNVGALPIHAAATVSEPVVAWLISRGASLLVRTHKGKNPLHKAAAARQSNIIGLLLEACTDAARKEAVNQADGSGRTPLHYACRSGRPESVKLLLDAGANVNQGDMYRRTPLHACAEFDKRSVPKKPARYNWQEGCIKSDDDALRVTDIVRLLYRHGGSPLLPDSNSKTPMQLALENELEEMVAVLDEIQGEGEGKSIILARGIRLGPKIYLASHRRTASLIADELVKENALQKNVPRTCDQLLQLGAYDVLGEIASRGVPLSEKGQYCRDDFLETLVKWGFVDLFEKLGMKRETSDWIDGSLSIPFHDSRDLRPVLLTAAARDLPSMDLLTILVETFKADVNIALCGDNPASALHLLARGTHWWQADGIQYLVRHGANVNLVDKRGRTPLHLAVEGGYRRLSAAKALLENGADPNILDEKGVAPLSLAIGDNQMVSLLIRNGADLTGGDVPFLFKAISLRDVYMVRVILEAGIDCNKPFRDGSAPTRQTQGELNPFSSHTDEQKLQFTPLQHAALLRVTNNDDKAKILAIMRLLMEHGADPQFSIDGDTTVLHQLLSCDGVVDPLLATPGLDLERRDKHGRSLLLVALADSDGEGTKNYRPLLLRLEIARKLYDMGGDVSAVDNRGNTAVHLLIEADDSGRNRTVTRSFREQDTPNGVSEFVLTLLDKYPPLLHMKNRDGFTPFHLAARKPQTGMTQKLIQAGADYSTPCPDGNTMLHCAAAAMAKYGRTHLDEALELGLDINARNKNGDTPLSKYIISAKPYPSRTGVQDFRDAGADISTRNDAGETLLHLIARAQTPEKTIFRRTENSEAEQEVYEMFKYFMELGLDPFSEDFQQRTPVDVAAAYGKNKILELFQKK
ncbi:ankyrin repeat-containing domain protein [Aspergillus californicus]